MKQHLEEQWQACKEGKFKQTPDDFLGGSWQGEALKSPSNGNGVRKP